MSTDWFREWFSSEEYLSVYRHRDDQDAQILLNTLFENIFIPPNAKILDAACGAGRHAIILANNGYQVTAFDLSKTLIKIGINKAKEQKLDINFINADIRYLCLLEKFDLILNLFTSFGYFHDDYENNLFIKNSSKMLKPEGFFVLDYINKNYVIKNLIPVSEKRIGSKFILEKRQIINNRIEKEIIIEEGGKKKMFKESVKLYDKNKIISMFNNEEFEVERILGDYEGSQYKEDNSKRLIIIFRK